MVPTWTAGLT